jgi:hypothetical protein
MRNTIKPKNPEIDVRLFTVSERSDQDCFISPLDKIQAAMLVVEHTLPQIKPLLEARGVSKLYIYPEPAHEGDSFDPDARVRICCGFLGKEGELQYC